MKGETGTGDYGHGVKKTFVEYVRDDLGCRIGLAHDEFGQVFGCVDQRLLLSRSRRGQLKRSKEQTENDSSLAQWGALMMVRSLVASSIFGVNSIWVKVGEVKSQTVSCD